MFLQSWLSSVIPPPPWVRTCPIAENSKGMNRYLEYIEAQSVPEVNSSHFFFYEPNRALAILLARRKEMFAIVSHCFLWLFWGFFLELLHRLLQQ